MSDVFISYAQSTAPQAQRIAEALRTLGYRVWRDDELPAHRAYADVIEERLAAAKAVVVIWSAEAAKSEWVRSEAERARGDRKLVQLTVDRAKLPMPFDQIQCADLTGWHGETDSAGWRKVVASIAELSPGALAESASALTVAPARRVSVCVLPFANMSDDPQQEYFSDGISEDIITDLSKVSTLSVVARNTAFGFKGKSPNVKDVARALVVSHVLEGSVRKAGNRVRITAQLIDGAAGDHVWAERYDRDLTDIFAVQDEISQAIVAALKLKLAPEEKKAIVRRGTNNLDAYNLYLMGRQQLASGNVGDGRREESIIRLCRRAIEIDQQYAQAWALMALAQSLLRFDRGKSGDDGLEAAERALALDPMLGDPHAVRAKVLDERGGRSEEALEEIAIALRLEPESERVHTAAAMIYLKAGRYEDAIRHYETAVSLNGDDFSTSGMLVSLYSTIGDAGSAARAAAVTLAGAEKAIAQDPNNGHAMAFAANALATLGERERFNAMVDRALLLDPDNALMRYNFACTQSAVLHDIDGAIAMLGPVFDNMSLALLSACKTDPDLAPIRDDPRFQAGLAAAEARQSASGGV